MFWIDLARCFVVYSMFRIAWTHTPRHNLQFYWNSSNPFFQTSGFLTVYLGDLIDFLCPHYSTDDLHHHALTSIEYNTLYLVNEEDYHRCETVNYQPLVVCDRPLDSARLIYTLSISKYLPYPNVPEFDVGQLYYFVSTSSGFLSQIDQRRNGLCQTKNMKLIINVERYYRHFYGEQGYWSRPVIAKRTNLTFIDPIERLLSASSQASHSVHFLWMLLLITVVLSFLLA